MFSKRSPWQVLLLLALLLAGPRAAAIVHAQQPQPPKAAQDEFVPINELPPDEKLPAARMLIAAYAVAWIVVAGYLFSIWRRLDRVEHEIADASRRIQQRGPR